MNDTKLAEANKLAESIKANQAILVLWENAKRFNNDGIYIGPMDRWAPVSPQTFEIVKALNIAYFTSLVADLQTEFQKL